MHSIFFDDDNTVHFLPLTYTRPVGALRIGIFTLAEKWSRALGTSFSYFTSDHLTQKYPLTIQEDQWLINPRFLPNSELIQSILDLQVNESIWFENTLIAARLHEDDLNTKEKRDTFQTRLNPKYKKHTESENLGILRAWWDLFSKNEEALRFDFSALDQRASSTLNSSVEILGNQLFVESGVDIKHAIINTETGPVYLGKNTQVMEGAVIRGPFALLEGSVVKMGAKVYGATTIGPYSKIGGELNNVVFQGFSNKGHDGFLGNAVVGEWCNFGADTNNSNLKNNYASVKVWSYATKQFIDTGLQFCGLAMGDHSKTGINTMLNTGTIIGVGCNVFGAGFPRTFVPSFTWGGANARTTHKLNKMTETAEIVMLRRDVKLCEDDKVILSHIFEETKQFRS
jgi:UDP-N-acetylglucosamine diphosphorylase/glucosamine-1-phosphate N-acetyltransferase